MGEARRRRLAMAPSAAVAVRSEIAEAARALVDRVVEAQPTAAPLLNLALSEPAAASVLAAYAPADHTDCTAVVLDALRRPGRAGVLAMVALRSILPVEYHASLLADAIAHGADRNAVAFLLVDMWGRDSFNIIHEAGSPERLAAWFAYADLPGCSLPVIRRVIDASPLPERLTLYRGGLGDPRAVAAGVSWTPRREVAAYYAYAVSLGEGRPVVVRREARRAEVAAVFPRYDTEHVVPAPGPWTLDTVGPAAIEALAHGIELEHRAADVETDVWADAMRRDPAAVLLGEPTTSGWAAIKALACGLPVPAENLAAA